MENFIERLSRLKHRLSGTPENKQGVQIIGDIFDSFGWETRCEGFRVPGSFAYGFAVNILVLSAIYFFLRDYYVVSLVLYGVGLISFWGELALSFHWLRRLGPRHGDCNIEARWEGEDDVRPLVIVSAHHDTPRSGMIYREKVAGRLAPLMARVVPPFRRLFFLPFFGAVLLGVGLGFRPVAAAAPVVTAISVFACAILGLTLFLVVQWGLSVPSPGANDNSSGVLVLLELARRLSVDRPSGVSVRLLATGAEETGMLGVREYIRRHKKEFQKRDIFFINIESVGGGELCWVESEEFLGKVRYPAEGFDVLDRLERGGDFVSLPRERLISPTDGTPLARAGFPVLTLVGLEGRAMPSNYHRVTDTFDRLNRQNLQHASDIIERIIRRFPG